MVDTKLNSDLVLRRSFDEANDRLKVDAEVTATVGTVDVVIDAAGGDNIAISDGTDTLAINPDGSINVVTTIDTTGLATEAKQDSTITAIQAVETNQTDGTQKTQLVDAAGDIVDVVQLNAAPIGTNKGLVTQSIIHGLNSGGGGTYVDVKVNPAGKLLVTADLEQGGSAVGPANPVQVTLANTGANTTAVKVDGSAVTQPISAVSLPLPTGAATSANQTSTNTKLDTINTSINFKPAVRLDEASATVTYIGEANAGSVTSDPVWLIKKIDETSGIVVTFADGNTNYDNIWDNRTSLTYS